jgi:hypothetical protein
MRFGYTSTVLCAAAWTALVAPELVGQTQWAAAASQSAGTPVQLWLDGRTAPSAPTSVTASIGQILSRQTVVTTNLDASLNAVLFVALVEKGTVICQVESKPFSIPAAAAIPGKGAPLGRMLPAFPDVCFKPVSDASGAYYALANKPVSAAAFASRSGEMVIDGIYDAPRSIKNGRVLLLAVIPASTSARKSAQAVPMMIGL